MDLLILFFVLSEIGVFPIGFQSNSNKYRVDYLLVTLLPECYHDVTQCYRPLHACYNVTLLIGKSVVCYWNWLYNQG